VNITGTKRGSIMK